VSTVSCGKLVEKAFRIWKSFIEASFPPMSTSIRNEDLRKSGNLFSNAANKIDIELN
jgi:hypothetical protein